MELRSNFVPGTPRWATRRTQWRQLGLTDEDLTKPKIAIVNSSSKLAPCFSHLDPIAAAVKESIRLAGGVGIEIRTVAPTDFIMTAGGSGGYILSGRDLVSMDIEAAVEGAQLDGMVCLASCDKTTPGQLMAAARLNVPTLIISCGYQSSGFMANGDSVDIEEVFLKAGHVKSGRVTFEQLCDMSDRAITSPGVCTGMGTANSMHVVAEALGMTLSASTPTAANSAAMWSAVERSGAAIVEAVLADRRPRDIMTPDAFDNAAKAVLAISGSINCIKHLAAIARETEADVDVYRLFESAAATIRPLSAVRPNGDTTIEQFDAAGGAAAVLKQLLPSLNSQVLTVTGENLGERLDHIVVADDEVIRPMDRPMGTMATIVVIRGSLAPESAIVKLSVTEERELRFTGTARTFGDPASALTAIEGGGIVPGDVLVLRGLGPVGTPGMGMASNVVFALNGAGLTESVAVVTDGQLSGLVNKGIVVGEVSPEGALDGPLGLVHDGDTIAIDVTARTVDLLVPFDELSARRDSRLVAEPKRTAGWLAAYAGAAEPLQKGATVRSGRSTLTYG
ncbi:dihydroxy-acid dehydratase [Parafrigoribacterium mesophilum]|uniref:dihydroxy-acid dehydratase n=1 Tax=Parafrigoribacterium mesophilum TaxID=433646 RepID=UPI0031FCAC32